MENNLKNQRLTDKQRKKNDFEWYKEQINMLDKISFRRNKASFFSDTEIDWYTKDKVNYDLVNNVVNIADFEYVIKPFGDEVGELPATFSNKDIISGKVKLLQGLEMKRPFSWKVMAVNEEATTRREQEEFNRHKQFVISQIMIPIQEDIIMKHEEQMKGGQLSEEEQKQIKQQIQEELQAATPDEVKRYMERDHQDPVEAMAHQLMEYLILKNDMAAKFNDGWKHALITAREIYFVTEVNRETEIKVVNPLRFDSDTSTDIHFIEDGEWAVAEFRMRPSEVVKTFDLTDEEIDNIYELNNKDAEHIYETRWFEFDDDLYANRDTVRVLHCVFKSLTKIGFLTSINPETGQLELSMVNEDYKLNEEIGDIDIDWEWIPSVYQGYKIGRDIYKEMGPLSDQYRSLEDPYYCKLPYYGAVYDNMNSAPTSLVDRMKVYQYYYNIIMYRIELLMASDQGKIIFMNLNAIPKSSGIDVDKFMYYAQASKIAYVDPTEEGNLSNNIGEIAKEVDMSLASDIQKYIGLAEYIEERCGSSVGITKQLEGQIGPYEGVRNTQQVITQSSHILEPYFDLHNLVKRNVLQGMIENAKTTYANSPKRKLTYVLDDLSRHILNIDNDQLMLSDYGIFVSNSYKAHEAKELVTQLTHAAMQNQKIELSDVVKVVRSNGIQEAEELLVTAEKERKEEESREQQAQRQHEQQMAEDARNFEREKWDREDQQVIIKEEERRKTELQKQAMLSMGFNEDKDMDKDGIPDVLEIYKAGADADVKARKQKLDEEKFEEDKKQHQDKMKLENKKLRQNKTKNK